MLNVAATDGRVLARIEFSIRSFTLQLPFTSYSSLLSYPLLFFISCISVPHPPCSHLSTNYLLITNKSLSVIFKNSNSGGSPPWPPPMFATCWICPRRANPDRIRNRRSSKRGPVGVPQLRATFVQILI